MKKTYFLILMITLFFITGCFKKDSLEDVTIYTTNYPIEYITQRLYGTHASIFSVYPNDVDIKTYELNDKQLSDYSKGRLFIYNGISNEKNYALAMLNNNKKLLIIDAAMDMSFTNKEEEIWLDPSNFLMMARNVKEGFKEYITNTYMEKEIDENYDKLKIDISEIDAEINLIVENASNKTIVVADDLFLFLEKYGLNVLSLEDNKNLTAKRLDDIEKLMSNKKVDYIFIKDNDELNEKAKGLVNKYNITPISFRTASNLSETERSEKVDLLKIMYNNIEALKKELYE